MIRTIYLTATGRTVTIGQYVKAVKLAKQNLKGEFKHGLTTWWPVTGADIMRQFLDGVNERINDAVPYCQRGVTA